MIHGAYKGIRKSRLELLVGHSTYRTGKIFLPLTPSLSTLFTGFQYFEHSPSVLGSYQTTNTLVTTKTV